MHAAVAETDPFGFQRVNRSDQHLVLRRDNAVAADFPGAQTSRDKPLREAKSSRERPAKARPARNRLPVSLGIMQGSFHRWNAKHQYDKLHTAWQRSPMEKDYLILKRASASR